MPTIGGWPKEGAHQAHRTPPAIEPRLKKVEAMAGRKKRPLVFRIPMTAAAKDTRIKKGNMIVVRSRVRAILPGTRLKSEAISRTISSEKMIPAIVIRERRMVNVSRTLLAKRQADSWPFFRS